jgi:hypothetical protein
VVHGGEDGIEENDELYRENAMSAASFDSVWNKIRRRQKCTIEVRFSAVLTVCGACREST